MENIFEKIQNPGLLDSIKNELKGAIKEEQFQLFMVNHELEKVHYRYEELSKILELIEEHFRKMDGLSIDPNEVDGMKQGLENRKLATKKYNTELQMEKLIGIRYVGLLLKQAGSEAIIKKVEVILAGLNRGIKKGY